jgi:hypothetical protein
MARQDKTRQQTTREARVGLALRENLKRRKGQVRARSAQAPAQDASGAPATPGKKTSDPEKTGR